MPIPHYTRSWLMLIPLIPSIAVTIFDLYLFLRNRAVRTALNNHVIILLLVCGLLEQVTDIAWQAHFYRTRTALMETDTFCRAWAFFGGAAYAWIYIVMMWASIERHILIFHSHWLNSQTKRLLFHYLPLLSIILWPALFYSMALFVIPCSAPINYSLRFCNLYSCVSGNYKIVALIDSAGNFMSTAFLTVIFSISLLIRVTYHRNRVRQRVDWRNYRKLAIQLLPISALYAVLQVPPMALYAAVAAGYLSKIPYDWYSDGLFFTYWVAQLTPFVVALSHPEWHTKFQHILLFWRTRRPVAPLTWTRPNGVQSVESPPFRKEKQ